GRAAHAVRPGAASLLRHRALWPVRHADPRAGLPRSGPARAAAAVRVRQPEEAARDVRTVAPRRLAVRPAALAHPLGDAGAVARGGTDQRRARPAADPGDDPGRPRAGPAGLVPRAVFRELGRRRPLPPPRLAAAQWPRHDRAVRRAGVA